MSDSHAHPTPDHGTPGAHDDHAHAHEVEHIKKHLRGYYMVGGTLLVFTLITVALAYVDFPKIFGLHSHSSNFIIGMIVATFKVCLVGAIFMHLKGEKPTIWRFLYFTMFFVLGLFLLSLLHHFDPIWGSSHWTH